MSDIHNEPYFLKSIQSLLTGAAAVSLQDRDNIAANAIAIATDIDRKLFTPEVTYQTQNDAAAAKEGDK